MALGSQSLELLTPPRHRLTGALRLGTHGSKRKQESQRGVLQKLASLLPVATPSAKGGGPRQSDEQALNGIIFVLRTGIPWEDLPQELGYGTGMTCWRRLRDWQAADVWHKPALGVA